MTRRLRPAPRAGRIAAFLFAGFLLLAAFARPHAGARVEFTVADLSSPYFRISGLRGALALDGAAPAVLEAREVNVAGRTYRDVRLTCAALSLSADAMECPDGRLVLGEPMAVRLRYGFRDGRVGLALAQGNEVLSLAASVQGEAWSVDAAVDGASLLRLLPHLPPDWPALAAGRVSGTLNAAGRGSRLERLEGRADIAGVAFSDAPGLHAGERIGGAMRVSARDAEGGWAFSAALDWTEGEAYWAPLYVPGGVYLRLEGRANERHLDLARWSLRLAGVGTAEGTARVGIEARAVEQLTARAAGLDLGAAYRLLLKPTLSGHAANLAVSGVGGMDAEIRGGRLATARLEVSDAALATGDGRVSVRGIEASLPWRADGEAEGALGLLGGIAWNVPLEAVSARVTVRPDGFAIERMEIPVLDGMLTLQDIEAQRGKAEWRWALGGALSAISMERVTGVLGATPMHGSLSAVIPRLAWADSKLRFDGALLFRLFGGTLVARNLVAEDPLGRVARITGDLEMRNLDLDLLTRTFSFGSITGRIDGDVQGLELVNGQPVRFDARVESGPGDYRRRISQRAVQNISALGGAGASAALSRTFLRFFEEFGYSKLGLSCVLRNGVCRMSGVEDLPQGYVIVKGGGIPAINVIGYNRAVGWNELVGRLRRIARENITPVVQ